MHLKTRRIASVALLAALTAVCAQVVIPLPLVPITLQTFAVILSGLLLGPGGGALSQLVYLCLGAAGLPVFAGFQGGVAALVGPHGGYLWGFVAAALVAGFIGSDSTAGLGRLIAAALVAALAVYAVGLPWLAAAAHLPLGAAFTAGMLPFLPGDAAKAVFAAYLARAIRRRGVGGGGGIAGDGTMRRTAQF